MRIRGTVLLVLLSLAGQLAVAQAASAHDIVYLPFPDSFIVESEEGSVDIRRGTHGRGTATVRASTEERSATPGTDYTTKDEVITFPEPIGAHEFLVPFANDSEVELLETIGIRLSEPTGGVTIAGSGEGSITIIDDDGAARLSFATASVTTYENFLKANLVVIRSGSVGGVSSFDYVTADGTAVATSDYEATSGTITFDAGQRIKRFTVALLNDRVLEEQETFWVELSSVTGAETSEPSRVEVVIEDDENPVSDTTPPVTFFHQPLHERTYRAALIRDFLVQTEDLGSGIKKVHIALRAKMKSGACRWYKHRLKGFVRGPCDSKVWGVRLPGADTAYYTLRKRLRPSRGTNIRSYTAWSRGIDQVGNVERSFDRKRNFSMFEVR